MVRVAACKGPTASLPSARITSDGSAANSAAYLRVSLRVVDHRTSMRALRPSVQPSACRACANTTMRACASGSLAAIVIRMPIRRFLSACCPLAASGKAAAAPNDRYCGGCRLCCEAGCGRGACGDDGHLTTNQIGCQRRQSVILATRPAILDRHVATFDKAGFLQALAK